MRAGMLGIDEASASTVKSVVTDSDTKKMGLGTLAIFGILGYALCRISKGSYK